MMRFKIACQKHPGRILEIRVEDNLCDKLKPSVWDSTKPSGRAKEVRPFDRHAGPRGYKGVRDVGKYKVDECRFSKL